MPFEWIDRFQRNIEKSPNYAEKTLAAYRLGLRAGGSLRGVRIVVAEDACSAAQKLPPETVYHPDDAPRLPLSGCPQGRRCTCVYRPVMTYENTDEPDDSSGERPA